MNKIISSVLAVTIAAGAIMTGCNSMDKDFSSDYVAGIMDASYKGQFNGYMKMTEASEEEAQELYDNTVAYYNDTITYYCSVSTEDISEDILNEYTAFTEDLLSKAKYTISSAENGKESCYVKISIKPINLIEQVEDEVESYIDEFNNKLADIGEEELEAYTDAQFQELENEYAEGILEILKNGSENLEYKDSIDFTMEIKVDDDNLYAPANENDWNTIDDYVMGIYE